MTDTVKDDQATPAPEKRSNNADQGAGQHEPNREALLENETLAAFAYRVNRPVDMVRYANLESVAEDQSILPGVTGLVVPDLT